MPFADCYLIVFVSFLPDNVFLYIRLYVYKHTMLLYIFFLCLSKTKLCTYGFQQIRAQREVMAVTLMLFVRLPKAHTSVHVRQALKEMENTAKVIFLLVKLLPKPEESKSFNV